MLADYTPDAFHDLARRLARHLRVSMDEAEELAAHLGDVWEVDEQGHVLIRDPKGHLLARVPKAVVDPDD